jgi:hypothetical protein
MSAGQDATGGDQGDNVDQGNRAQRRRTSGGWNRKDT